MIKTGVIAKKIVDAMMLDTLFLFCAVTNLAPPIYLTVPAIVGKHCRCLRCEFRLESDAGDAFIKLSESKRRHQ